MSDQTSGIGYAGQAGLEAATSDFNKTMFAIVQALGLLNVMTPVKVVTVYGGGLGPVGLIDAQPLVNQIDGLGNATPHGVVKRIGYFRLFGGNNAVVMDPVAGDVGFAVFADRDISAVKASGGQANPGSRRRFSMADGIYIGGFLSGTPTCYVNFDGQGMTLSPDAGVTELIIHPGLIRLVAAEVNVHGTSKTTIDANGTGQVMDGAAGTIVTYSNGGSSHASTPPEVPT